MRAFLLVCLVSVALANPASNDNSRCKSGTCTPTDPPGLTVRCPDCVSQQCTPNMCSIATILPYPGNCAKFCMCEAGGAIEMDCPPGLVFDVIFGLCVWPQDSSCSDNAPYPGCDAPIPTTQAATTTTQAPATTTTQAPATTNLPECTTTPPCTTVPPKPLERCPDCVNAQCTPNMCNLAVGVPYPNNCNRFCVCENGGAIAMDCPSGLVFNPNLGVCDWEYNVPCSNSDPYPGC